MGKNKRKRQKLEAQRVAEEFKRTSSTTITSSITSAASLVPQNATSSTATSPSTLPLGPPTVEVLDYGPPTAEVLDYLTHLGSGGADLYWSPAMKSLRRAIHPFVQHSLTQYKVR